MRGAAVLVRAKNGFKNFHNVKATWGSMAISAPKKQESKNLHEAWPISNNKGDPIVTFSKPPPPPPIVGPLVALSLLETWFSRDSSDD